MSAIKVFFEDEAAIFNENDAEKFWVFSGKNGLHQIMDDFFIDTFFG